MSVHLNNALALLLAGSAALSPAVQAQEALDPSVSIQGINIGGDFPFAMVSPSFTSASGDTGTSQFQVTGPWSVQGSGSGEFRGGPWSSVQSASLATGVMRSSLHYASDDPVGRFSQLGTYLDMLDYLTFHGSGSATFVMRLTGRFTGQGHADWGNSMDTSLDLTSMTRGGFADVLGRINLNHREDGQASFTAGSNCPGFGFGFYQLGTVNCTIRSLAADALDIDLRVQVNDISDGEVLMLRSTLNVQAYGLGGGGSDFGNTARLGVVLSDGLGFSSASGSFLSLATPVPEPGSLGLMAAGLAMLGLRALRQRA